MNLPCLGFLMEPLSLHCPGMCYDLLCTFLCLFLLPLACLWLCTYLQSGLYPIARAALCFHPFGQTQYLPTCYLLCLFITFRSLIVSVTYHHH